jgi:hypothetical protein
LYFGHYGILKERNGVKGYRKRKKNQGEEEGGRRRVKETGEKRGIVEGGKQELIRWIKQNCK